MLLKEIILSLVSFYLSVLIASIIALLAQGHPDLGLVIFGVVFSTIWGCVVLLGIPLLWRRCLVNRSTKFYCFNGLVGSALSLAWVPILSMGISASGALDIIIPILVLNLTLATLTIFFRWLILKVITR